MKKYNTYIKEKYLEWLDYSDLSVDQFNKILNSSDFSDFNENDKPIYRSIQLDKGLYILNPTGKLRKSAWCVSNHYTLLINNLQSWSEYPKRIHICSSQVFRFNRNVFRVIPINGTKIGICPSDDIQAPFKTRPASIEIYRKTEGNIESLLDLNYYYTSFSYEEDTNRGEFRDGKKISDDNWDEFKKDITREKERILSEKEKYLNSTIKITENLFDINRLNELFEPNGLGFQSVPYNEYKHMELGPPDNRIHEGNFNSHEVWLDSTILLQSI